MDKTSLSFPKDFYQGASGRVYPDPLTDHIANEKKIDKSYLAVFLENEYIQLMMLPELGGRIFAGLDKTNGYNFFYRQHVIKPALIGLFGSWISGVVDFRGRGIQLATTPSSLNVHAGRALH